MLSKKKRKEQAQKLTKRAVAKYGELKNRKARPPLDQLILSTLFHYTSVRRGTRALRELKRKFVDWNEIRVSHPAEVAAAICSAQWARRAAEQVIWQLREIFEVYNRTNLDFLTELTPTQARTCLRGLPMIPREMADEVLLLSLNVPVLPCSAAVSRMCYRLGLLENDRPTLKNQRALAKLFDEEYFVPLHLFFCDHAERFCRADEPLCKECPVSRPCPSAGKTNK